MGIKYSREEIERRWLLNSQSLPNLTELEMWEVTDKYFEETRLRLRRMYSPKTRKEVYKLCKKYGKTSDISEPITNLYLTNAEHTLIDQIPGIELRKRKYEYPHYGVLFSVEEILGTKAGLFLLEAEFPSEKIARSAVPPPFAGRDVTNEEEYQGFHLATSSMGSA